MTYTEYRKSVKTEVAELLKAQLNMALTEGARASAHSQLQGLLMGAADEAWEMFDFS